MADTPWDVKHAFQKRGAGDEPGDAVVDAILRVCRAAEAASGLHPYVQTGFVVVSVTVELIEWWKVNKTIPQCQLIEGVPEKGGAVYKQEVIRYSQEPYTFTYSHPTDTITGIACVPMNKEIQSPEAEVTEGGINCNFVTIRLTPVKKGEWACNIAICGKSSAAKPAREVPQQAIQKAVKQDDQLAVQQTVKQAVQEVVQTIKQAVQEAVQEVVKQAVQEAVQAVQQNVKEVVQEAVKQAAQQAIQESVQQAAQQAKHLTDQQVIQQAVQQDTQQAVKQNRRRRRRRL